MADFAKIIEEIKTMTVLELSELVKAIETEFGVSAAAGAVVSGGDAGDAGAAGGKDTFDVILVSAGEAKMNVIKAVKEIMALGLKEAKAVVDEAPKTIKEGVSEAEAEEIKKALTDAGATVELK